MAIVSVYANYIISSRLKLLSKLFLLDIIMKNTRIPDDYKLIIFIIS